jgi:hypothetical protein
MVRSSSDVCVSSPGTFVPLADGNRREQEAALRDLLPAPRQLPFNSTTAKDAVDKIPSKSLAGRKRKTVAEDAADESIYIPTKKRSSARSSQSSAPARQAVTKSARKAPAVSPAKPVADRVPNASQGNISSTELLTAARSGRLRKTSDKAKAGSATPGNPSPKKKSKAKAATLVDSPVGEVDEEMLERGSHGKKSTRQVTTKRLKKTAPPLKQIEHSQTEKPAGKKSSRAVVRSRKPTVRAGNKVPTPERPRTRLSNKAKDEVKQEIPTSPRPTPRVPLTRLQSKKTNSYPRKQMSKTRKRPAVKKGSSISGAQDQDFLPAKENERVARPQGPRLRGKASKGERPNERPHPSQPQQPRAVKNAALPRKISRKTNASNPRSKSVKNPESKTPTPPPSPDQVAEAPLIPTATLTMQQSLLPVVFDMAVQKQLEQLAEPLFQQYEEDIARGCDEETRAKFYLERIHSVRRDFWGTVFKEVEKDHGAMITV